MHFDSTKAQQMSELLPECKTAKKSLVRFSLGELMTYKSEEWSKEEDWVSYVYQMNFSTAVLPMHSKWLKLTKFEGILHKHFFQKSSCFLFLILFPAEYISESKTGKVIKINFKLDLLFIWKEYRYINYTPRLWS